uniref:Expansin-like EG45 domain-containing protein n=1 Tax=Tetradesmus obliquus TaxID=3088 RepID=A0A383V9X8_TETOB|eukprot:jgi/Sobl393_1/11890/SZX62385.1
MGRSFPGNAGEEKAVLDVKCWGDQKSVVVKVIDICPCWYEPKGMAPYFQYGCCYKQQQHPKAGQLNLDLSFWAFEQLAHPEYGIMMVDYRPAFEQLAHPEYGIMMVDYRPAFEQLAHPEYGIMMVDYRPVDCDTKKSIQFDPGYISDKIYDNFPGVGWSWFAYNFQPMNKFAVVDAGKGLKGSAASCAELQYNGGMTWACRQCGSKEGFQPFAGADSVTFWMRDSGSPGKVPPVRLQLGNPDIKKSCNAKLDLATRTPQSRTADGWLQFTIPLHDFDCPEPALMNQLLWEAKPGTSSGFGMCLDEVSINRPGAAAPAAGPPASG